MGDHKIAADLSLLTALDLRFVLPRLNRYHFRAVNLDALLSYTILDLTPNVSVYHLRHVLG